MALFKNKYWFIIYKGQANYFRKKIYTNGLRSIEVPHAMG
jgi:hypothetical protein